MRRKINSSCGCNARAVILWFTAYSNATMLYVSLTRCRRTLRASLALSGYCRISARAWLIRDEGLFSFTSLPISMKPMETREVLAIKSAMKMIAAVPLCLEAWPNLPSWKDERTVCCPEAFSWHRRGRRWPLCRSAGLCRKHGRTFWRRLQAQATKTPAHTERLRLKRLVWVPPLRLLSPYYPIPGRNCTDQNTAWY